MMAALLAATTAAWWVDMKADRMVGCWVEQWAVPRAVMKVDRLAGPMAA
jgi:hypothetical protein